MIKAERWLLPEGVEELLPPQAKIIESLRRQLIDLHFHWGYDLVMPPMIEYLESLLTETWHDLDLQTFKITDQLTGRLMGLRADFTPQVSRIDAHSLKQTGPTRLCYCGSVLHTKPSHLTASRSPIQLGAELYGHGGIESDIEILCLMLDTLTTAGLKKIHLDLGHVGIYRQLIGTANLTSSQEQELFDLLQSKTLEDIKHFLDANMPNSQLNTMLFALAQLNGNESILKIAQEKLKNSPPIVLRAIDDLMTIGQVIKRRFPQVALYFDLTELRGYHYHTGLVFSAYVPEQGHAVAHGGRYDDVGRVFGRARPATGFSTDLKSLVSLTSESKQEPNAIAVCFEADDDELWKSVQQLRQQGERVIVILPGQTESASNMGCNRKLIKDNNQWVVKGL